jgi:hypothetical protein
MRADIEGGIIKYLLLYELTLLFIAHLALEEVKGCISFLDFDGFTLSLLFLE